MRELAAQALSLLVQYDMDYFGGHALEKLVPCTLSSDLCTRHGATLAAGEVALRLNQLGFTFSTGKSCNCHVYCILHFCDTYHLNVLIRLPEK